MGPDDIHPWVLVELADEVPNSLAIIFEKSWKTGEVATGWEKGKHYHHF